MGDFNLDLNMSDRNEYQRKVLLSVLNDFVLNSDLIQVVNFNTWSRNINGVKKQSLLDHIYVNNLSSVRKVDHVTPTFGDHELIMIEMDFKEEKSEILELKRNWAKYSGFSFSNDSKSDLITCGINWRQLNVGEHWNSIEHVLINCVDKHAPLINISQNHNNNCKWLPNNVKQKLNKRKRLIRLDKRNNSIRHAPQVRVLDGEIRTYFALNRNKKVRQILGGSKANL